MARRPPIAPYQPNPLTIARNYGEFIAHDEKSFDPSDAITGLSIRELDRMLTAGAGELAAEAAEYNMAESGEDVVHNLREDYSQIMAGRSDAEILRAYGQGFREKAEQITRRMVMNERAEEAGRIKDEEGFNEPWTYPPEASPFALSWSFDTGTDRGYTLMRIQGPMESRTLPREISWDRGRDGRSGPIAGVWDLAVRNEESLWHYLPLVPSDEASIYESLADAFLLKRNGEAMRYLAPAASFFRDLADGYIPMSQDDLDALEEAFPDRWLDIVLLPREQRAVEIRRARRHVARERGDILPEDIE